MTNTCVAATPSKIRRFSIDVERYGVRQHIGYDVEIPLAEYMIAEDLFGHLITLNRLQKPFHKEVKKAFREFVVEETRKFMDSAAEEELKHALAFTDTNGTGDSGLTVSAELIARCRKEESLAMLTGADLLSSSNQQHDDGDTDTQQQRQMFAEYFQSVMSHATPDQLAQLIDAEHSMSEEMATLVRARDFEMERLMRVCEKAVKSSSAAAIASDTSDSKPTQRQSGSSSIDEQCYSLSMLNEKLKHASLSYCHQIESLSRLQHKTYRELVARLYRNELTAATTTKHQRQQQSEDEEGSNTVGQHQSSPTPRYRGMRKSMSCDARMQRRIAMRETPRDESFTIYIGAPLKTMHNARITLCDRLADLCQGSSSSELNNYYSSSNSSSPKSSSSSKGCSPLSPLTPELFNSRRLQLLMSLYSRELSSVVLLVGREPHYHLHKRTQFAKMCEQSPELHFDSLELQLKKIETEARKANKKRREQRTSMSSFDESGGNESPLNTAHYDDSVLQPGDVYITCHSNLSSVHVIFHLVTDRRLDTEEISSRHACIGGLRNIIRISARCAISSISLPLLLVESMNEVFLQFSSKVSAWELILQCMTVSWCLTRAELMFKCLKGFLMEVCSTGSSSSSSTAIATNNITHYNITFALPSRISTSLFGQLVEMFSGIFHLVPSVSA